MMRILTGQDKDNTDPWTTVDLENARAYIHARATQITLKYENGIEKETRVHYPLVKCSKKYLSSTKFEQEFYDYFIEKKGQKYYCLEDEAAYLQATRDTIISKKETSYIIFEVIKCNSETKK